MSIHYPDFTDPYFQQGSCVQDFKDLRQYFIACYRQFVSISNHYKSSKNV